MLGISIYFKNINEQYIQKAASKGFRYVFTSLQIPEDDKPLLKVNLLKVIALANKYDMKLIVDISPFVKDVLGIDEYQQLKDYGIKVVRLDYGFDDIADVKAFMQDYEVILNASTIDEEYILELEKANVDLTKLTVMHNFYPQTLTAKSYQEFKNNNSVFNKHGLKTMAFVAGDQDYRYPLYEALPTIENTRGLNSYVASVILKRYCLVDDILIGDISSSDTSLDLMAKLDNGIISIPCIMYQTGRLLFDNGFEIRKDSPEHFYRITTPRIKGIKQNRCLDRQRGAIVMINELYGRYCGEVQIIKQSLNCDHRFNVIGYIHPEYVSIIDYLDSSIKVEFMEIEND